MVQKVEYELGLRDKFSAGILDAENAVKGFERSIKSAVIAGAGLFAGFEFLKDSVKAFNDNAQASAQLDASMKSTGNVANLNREALEAQAQALSLVSLNSETATTKLQSVLATFTNIRGEIFTKTVPAIEDLSAKMGSDLQSATVQVGKAMNDLSGQGLSRLKRSGVDFSVTQVQMIKHLFATNQAAAAQTIILQELNREFGGSAEAASKAGTGPFTVLKNSFEDVKITVGGMVTAIGLYLMPLFVKFIGVVRAGVLWVKEHGDMLKRLGIAIIAAYTAFKLFTLVPPILLAVENALVEAAVGATSLGESLVAALGPVTLLAAAVGGLVYMFEALGDARKKAQEADEAFLNKSADLEKNYLQEMVKAEGPNTQATRDKVAARRKTDLAGDLAFLQDQLTLPENKTEQRQSEINDAISENLKRTNVVDQFQMNLIPKKDAGTKKTPIESGIKEKPPKSQVTGAKNVTINVHINKVTGVETMSVTNIKESMNKIHDAVTAVMTGSVNDFQVVAAGT